MGAIPTTKLKTQNYADLPHILVVDDDDRIRQLITRYLTENGFLSTGAANAIEAKEILEIAEYDVMIIDVMMPGQDGISLTEELQKTFSTPIILLTALGETEDKIKGLTAGADDYLVKPFDPRELVLRLQSILRRSPVKLSDQNEVTIGDWTYNRLHKELSKDDAKRSLTDGDVTLLEALLEKSGEVIYRDALCKACDMDPDKRTIDVQITRLRRKIEEDSNRPRYIQTIRGKGYILRC